MRTAVATPNKKRRHISVTSDCESGQRNWRGCFWTGIPRIFPWNECCIQRMQTPKAWSGRGNTIDCRVRNVNPFLLETPSIVQFLGLVQTKKSVGMVCEYLPKNLKEVIFGSDSQEQNLDKVDLEDSNKLFITLGCLQGLAYLHAHNVVHADIKPANILVSSDMSVVKLCDMGLSRLKSTACATKTKHSVPGTLMYMAPESVLQNVMPNRSSDIWSMSATSCEVYAGSDFWNIGDGKADKYISTKMSNKKDPDGLCDLRKSYRAVHRLLKKGLQYEPTKRPSAVQLLSDFRNI